MRILIAHNRYTSSGGEDAVVSNETAMLRSHGHDVLLIQADNKSINGRADAIRAVGTLFYSKYFYESMCRSLATFEPDVVHLHNWFPLMSPSVIAASAQTGVPVVHTLHNFRMLCAKGTLYRDGAVCKRCVGKAFPFAGAIRACYRNSHIGSAAVAAGFAYHHAVGTWDSVSRFIALSDFQRDILVRGGVPQGRISLKPNFAPDIGPMGDGNGNYFLFVGRLIPEKGLMTALQAWEKHTIPAPLHIIGDGPMRNEVISASERCRQIRYLGHRTPAEVGVAMASAKALVFPSEWYEPFALTLIEALSHGTPVLASDIESIRALVQDDVTGLAFHTGSADDLANKANYLYDANASYQALRARCRAEYLSRYTEDANYALLLQIYKQVLRKEYVSAPEGPTCNSAVKLQSRHVPFPEVANIVGTPVHAVNMTSTLDTIHAALVSLRKGYICLAGAHGIMEARRDPALLAIESNAFLVLPDGMPTVWFGRAQGFRAMGRVFGPDLMIEVMRRAEFEHTKHFLWGGAPGVAEDLRAQLLRRFPRVNIVGTASPPFHELTKGDISEFSVQIAQLKPDVIWVGISTPKQDHLMAQLIPILDTTLMIGVGAAFLFHTGVIQDSPAWVKSFGLQWFHRLIQEPSRLWRRYLTCIAPFAFHAILQFSGLRNYPLPISNRQDTTGVQPFARRP